MSLRPTRHLSAYVEKCLGMDCCKETTTPLLDAEEDKTVRIDLIGDWHDSRVWYTPERMALSPTGPTFVAGHEIAHMRLKHGSRYEGKRRKLEELAASILAFLYQGSWDGLEEAAQCLEGYGLGTKRHCRSLLKDGLARMGVPRRARRWRWIPNQLQLDKGRPTVV